MGARCYTRTTKQRCNLLVPCWCKHMHTKYKMHRTRTKTKYTHTSSICRVLRSFGSLPLHSFSFAGYKVGRKHKERLVFSIQTKRFLHFCPEWYCCLLTLHVVGCLDHTNKKPTATQQKKTHQKKADERFVKHANCLENHSTANRQSLNPPEKSER